MRRNHVEAFKWFRIAAEQGDGQAQYMVSQCFHDGAGVTLDHAESLKWCCKAADQSLPGACYTVAIAFLDGKGTQQDSTEAARWLRKSGDLGDAAALYMLALLYGDGNGVSKNADIALQLLTEAAEQGCDHARCLIEHGFRFDVAPSFCKTFKSEATWVLQEAASKGQHNARRVAKQQCHKCLKRSQVLALEGKKLRHCSACRTAWYCSAECQRADWSLHKVICAVTVKIQQQFSQQT